MKRKDNIVDEFGQFTESYSQDMIRWVPNYMTMIQSLAKGLPPNFKARRILDLGCGNGNAVELIMKKFPNASYILLDASKDMLNICKLRFPIVKVELVESYFMDARFKSSSFDLILASFSLHHLINTEKQEIFKRIHSWLNSGGHFLYTDLMIDRENSILHSSFLKEWESQAKAQGTSLDEWEWLMEHHQVYDFTQDYQIQQQYLSQAGFPEIDVLWRKDYWASLVGIK